MRLVRASLVSLLLLCLLTGAVNAQTCPTLQSVQATLEGAQFTCRTSTGGTYTATEYGGGTSTHQWVYGPSASGPWTPIAGATGTTYRLTGSDFPSTGAWSIAVTSTPQCGSPMTSMAQPVSVYDTLPAPEMFGDDQICAGATSAIAQSAAQWDSYSWSITHGTLIPGSNDCGDDPTKRCVSFRPDGTGEVHLSLTVTAGSCSSNALRAVPLVENTPPSLSVWTPVCPGGQGSAMTSQYPSGVRTWSVTNAHIDTDWGDHIIFTADGNGPVDVTLTFTDSNGCSSSSTGRAQLAGTKPVITLGSPACPINGTASANGGWDSYDWSITNGTITYGQGTANISFSGSGGSPMVLTVTGRADYSTFSCTTASDPVTVPTVPTPTITLGTPDICPFGTDTASAPEGYENYWWSVNNGYIVGGEGTNSIRFSRGGYPNNPNDPITITLYVADANGCSAQSATATVPTRTIPAPVITLGTPDICPFGTDTATVPAEYANYWWSLNNGYLISGDGTNSIRFSRGGYPGNENEPITITLYVQDADGCPGPPATVTVPTRTIAAPVITLGTPDICPFGTNTATVPPQYANYWWSLNNGYLISGDGTNSIRFSRGGYPGNESDPITITLYGQDANGCPGPPATVTVPTRSIPAPVITLGTPDICQFGTDTASVPPEYANYWWSLNNGYLISGDGTNSIRFSRGGYPGNENDPITITLYVQDANGCPGPPATVTVPTRSIPAPAITLATPDICKFGTNTASVPPVYANYWWSLNNGYLMSGDGTNSITFSPGGMPGSDADPITITLYVQDANGCPAPPATVTVPIRTIPAPEITVASPDVCPFGSDSASVPAQYASYWWEITNGNITGGQNTNSITFTPLNAGTPVTISLTVQDGNGCPVSSAPISIPIRTIPAPVITASGSTSLCAAGSVTLTAPAGFSYSWSNGATTRAITVTQPGDYFVTVSDPSGCSAVSAPLHVTAATPSALVLTTSHDTTCLYGSIQATISNPSLFANITWSAAGGSIVPNGASSWTEADNGTVSQVSITAHATDVATGCPVSGTVVIPIVPLDPPVMTVSSNGPICYGTAVTISIPPQPAGSDIIWDYTGVKLGGGNGQAFITLSAPPSPSFSLRVRLTDPRSCSTQNTITVPVHLPVVPVLQADDRYGCAYAEKTVTVTNPSAYTSYTWSVTNGTIIGPNDQPTVHIGLLGPGVNTDVTFTASDGSCPITAFAGFYSTQPTASISGGAGSYCTGTTVWLSAVTDVTNATYLWSNGATSSSITATADAPGPYTVTVTNAYGCSTTSAPLTVHFAPQSTSVNASGATTFCAGGSVTLTPAMFGDSYLWSNGATTRTIDVTQSGAYSVTVTDASCQFVSPAMNVTVNPIPAATITPSGPTTFCAGGSVTLSAPAGYSYSWSNGATTQSITVNQSNTYTVTVHDANGCTASSSTTVTVNPLPAPAITASGPTTFCAGGSVTLAASAGYASYLWNTGATTQSIVVSSSNNYSVTVRDGNNCSGSSPAVAVTVRPLPTVTVSGTSAICPGGSATITAALTGTAPWTVTWSDNVTQTINSGTTASRSVSPSATKIYTVASLTDANCTGTSSGSATVTVKSLPTAAVSGGGAICPGASATITATLTGTAPFSVTWSDNVTQTINSGTTASRSVSPAATTTYTVSSVSDAASCPAAGTGNATVTVNAAASITTQPSNVTTTRNTNVTLSVATAGTAPISYKWFNGNGTAIAGATSSSYTTSFTKKGTNTFYVEVWNACNATHVKSTTVTVTVN